MRIERHYDEEVLAAFLREPADTTARDRHLEGCTLCQRTLRSIRETVTLLKKPAVWQKQSASASPQAATLAFLRNVQATMADEDSAAEGYVAQLLAGSRESWVGRLGEHPEWRTAGLVRKLIAATDRAIDLMPPDALVITRLACDVAGHLPDSDLVMRLRGNAWYERGYALFYTGAFHEALDALDKAESHFRKMVVAEHEMGRLYLVKGMVLRALEQVDASMALSLAAAAVFKTYGDEERGHAARIVTANNLYTKRRFREALRIHLETACVKGISERWRASALHSAAMCHRELGEMEPAIDCFVKAISAFEAAGMISFRAKARWTLACIFVAQQQFEPALSLFTELRDEFEDLGMPRDVALISLDIAEVLLITGRSEGVVNACRQAIAYFETRELTSTQPALTAVTYLCEAAVAGRATPQLVSDIRGSFFRDSSYRHPSTESLQFLKRPYDLG